MDGIATTGAAGAMGATAQQLRDGAAPPLRVHVRRQRRSSSVSQPPRRPSRSCRSARPGSRATAAGGRPVPPARRGPAGPVEMLLRASDRAPLRAQELQLRRFAPLRSRAGTALAGLRLDALMPAGGAAASPGPRPDRVPDVPPTEASTATRLA